MRVSTKRILSIGLSALFLIGALVVYLNLVRGATADVNARRAVLSSKTALLESQRQVVTQVQNLIAEFQNVRRLEETVSLAMPVGEQAIRAFRQLEAVARSSGVVLSALDFRASAPAARSASFVKRLGTLEVKVRADGSYESLKQFLRLLETGVRVSNVTELKYQPGTMPNAPDTLNLVVEMYYQE